MEITSWNQAELQEEAKKVILLDYVGDETTLVLSSVDEYIRLVGTPSKEYKLAIKIESRQTPLTIDFVNTCIYGGTDAALSSDADTELTLGFYGEKSGIRGREGDHGTNGGPFRTGGNGYMGLNISGDLHITIGASTCYIRGGRGGDGGNGSVGNDGGRGGDGAVAISARSIKASCIEGYTKDNFSVSGGSGGSGGAAGGWFFGTPSPGASGTSAPATSVEIYYQ